MQFAVGMGDRDPPIAWVLVLTGIVNEIAAHMVSRFPRALRGLPISITLRYEFAATLAKTIKPGCWLLAAHAVEDIIRKDVRTTYCCRSE
jgi:hypothetical protein